MSFSFHLQCPSLDISGSNSDDFQVMKLKLHWTSIWLEDKHAFPNPLIVDLCISAIYLNWRLSGAVGMCF